MYAGDKRSNIKEMNDGQKGYIAGIFDGEGHFYIRGEYEGAVHSAIRVRVTDSCITSYLRKVTGLGTICSYMPKQRRVNGEKKREIFEWAVRTRVGVRDLLNAVLPWLVLKKRRAYLLLELEQLKDQGINNGKEVARIRAAIGKEQGKRGIAY
jgi:hypothetical protein